MQKPVQYSWLILFTSMGTLLCCALPILLVTLGMGAVVASTVTALPWLVPLTANKIWVFAGSGVLLAFSGWLMYRSGRACPTDPEMAKLCERTQVWNRRVYWASVAIWCIGIFFAYLYLPIIIALGF